MKEFTVVLTEEEMKMITIALEVRGDMLDKGNTAKADAHYQLAQKFMDIRQEES